MMKVKNISSEPISFRFERNDGTAFETTLNPKHFVFLEKKQDSPILLLQKRRGNIDITEEKKPQHMEYDKPYLFYVTEPELKSAISESGMSAVLNVLEKEEKNEEFVTINLFEKGPILPLEVGDIVRCAETAFTVLKSEETYNVKSISEKGIELVEHIGLFYPENIFEFVSKSKIEEDNIETEDVIPQEEQVDIVAKKGRGRPKIVRTKKKE
jgi:hypothetical protein